MQKRRTSTQRIRRSYAYRMFVGTFVLLVASLLLCGTALANEVVYQDDEKHDLDDPNTTYVIRGDGTEHKSGNYFYVPESTSSEESPLVIILDNVNRTQAGCSPSNAFVTIAGKNYVVVASASWLGWVYAAVVALLAAILVRGRWEGNK